MPGSEKPAGIIKANSLPSCSMRMMDIWAGSYRKEVMKSKRVETRNSPVCAHRCARLRLQGPLRGCVEHWHRTPPIDSDSISCVQLPPTRFASSDSEAD